MPHSLKAKIKGLWYKGIITDKDCDRLCKALDQAPKIGYWIDTDNYYQRWKCSECGCHTRDAAPPFCSSCGAKMIEPQEREESEVEDSDNLDSMLEDLWNATESEDKG